MDRGIVLSSVYSQRGFLALVWSICIFAGTTFGQDGNTTQFLVPPEPEGVIVSSLESIPDPVYTETPQTSDSNEFGDLQFETVSQLFNSDNPYAYDDGGGFVIVSENDDSKNFSMTISGRLQARYTFFEDSGPFENRSSNDFEMERLRLGFRGLVYEDYLRYNIGTDWDSDGAGGTANDGSLLHAFVEFDLQKAVGFGFGEKTALRIGYARTNFGRQTAESSRRLQFVDRSLTSTIFNLGNNAGVALLGTFTHNYQPVRYELSLLNGFGTSSNTPRNELDNNLGVALRVTHGLIGEYDAGESDNQLRPFQALRVGGSLAYTHRTRRGKFGAEQEFDNTPTTLLAQDVGMGIPSFAMDQLMGQERDYDLVLGGVEADWKHCGWSFHSEYLWRVIDNVEFVGTETFSDFTHGFYFQGGYFLTEKMEIVGRHSSVFSHGRGTGSPIGIDYKNSFNATGGGLNFYFREHNSKFQIDVFYFDGAPVSSSSLNVLAGDRGTMLRAQYQLAF